MNRRTSTFSQDSEDSLLPLGELGSKPSPSAKVRLGADASSKGLGRSRSTRTSKRSTENDTEELTFSPEDRRASRAVAPGTSEARKMTVGSGTKLSGSLMKRSRMASFSKRLMESSTWASTEYLLRWSGSATRCNRSIFRLVPWGVRSFDTDSGLLASWATPCAQRAGGTPEQFLDRKKKYGNKLGQSLTDLGMQVKCWPTSCATDATRRSPETKAARLDRGAHTGTTLMDAIAGWPTPQARDTKGVTQNKHMMDALPNVVRAWPTPNASDGSGGPQNPAQRKKGKSGEKHSTQLVDYVGTPSYGCLATMDTYAERLMNLSAWLMGYTAAYLRHWETRSSRRKRTKLLRE